MRPSNLKRTPVCECGSQSYYWIGRASCQHTCVIECTGCGLKRESKAQAAWEFPEKVLDESNTENLKDKKPARATGRARRQQGYSAANPAYSLIAFWHRERAEEMQKTKLRGVACNRRSRRRWWILTAILVADGLILAGEVYLIWRWWIG